MREESTYEETSEVAREDATALGYLAYVLAQVLAPVVVYGIVWSLELCALSLWSGPDAAFEQVAWVAGAWRTVVVVDLFYAALAIAAHMTFANGRP